MPKGVLHSDNTLLANGRAMVQDWHHDDHTVLLQPQPAVASHRHGGDRAEPGRAGFELVVNDLQAGHEAARLDRSKPARPT